MSDKVHRTIAKELVVQTLNQFKKLRSESSEKQFSYGESSETSIPRNGQKTIPITEHRDTDNYDPSPNFNKIFSGLIGDKSSTNKTQKIYENLRISPSVPLIETKQPVIKSQDQVVEKEVAPASKVEAKGEDHPAASVSIFKRLSRGTN
ncbi:MAG: hypothetical protein V1915_04565 [Candidatus Bathyarchaeota archaeon]